MHFNSNKDNAVQLKKSIADGCMGLGRNFRGQQILEDVVGDINEFYWGRM
jgi:hypothetical protein